jgi:hypothetical protein
LITLMRERHGAERCRFLLCLDAEIAASRLGRLWESQAIHATMGL